MVKRRLSGGFTTEKVILENLIRMDDRGHLWMLRCSSTVQGIVIPLTAFLNDFLISVGSNFKTSLKCCKDEFGADTRIYLGKFNTFPIGNPASRSAVDRRVSFYMTS